MKPGKILVITAPSGTGKTTIIKKILPQLKNIVFSVSATTRNQRPGEIEGVDYFFVSKEKFLDAIANDEFVEWQNFYDNYYGTFKKVISHTIAAGKNILLDVEVKGALNLKEIFPSARLIFILPPSIDELEKRLERRNTESEKDLQKRIQRAKMELSLKDKFDYFVPNDNLENASEDLKNLINDLIEKEN